MNSILVPIDFSKHSLFALEAAAHLARQTNASILVLHMLGLSEAVLAKSETQEHQEAQYYMNLAKKRFRPLLEKPFLEGIEVEIMLQNYKIFSELDEIASEKGIDLIVMGSHGNGGIGTLVVGSNTDKVIRTSSVPVLVIKKEHSSFEIKKMVFSTHLGEETIDAYKKAKAFADTFAAQMEVVYINLPYHNFKSTKEIEKKIDVFKALAGGTIDVHVANDYSVGEGVMNFCERQGADLLVIPTHGRKGLVHFFKGSIGEKMAKRSTVPVLTIRI
ncbi:universal stress protein [Flagellimonas lutaonensis]|uniref:Universal stress protein UspA n=1 Tax=Flagellimonas lutaonensis TaxID=516051 RepID=A0A0D5YVJ5_9FLAO|nr:universal stress protein [Allomuricauda lutaonensis]AKA35926.1 universal stress protein UspA [Allomuricauda lutaonensis]